MRDFREAKSMAKILRSDLGARDIKLTHSDCLELVARQFGFNNWNVLAAKIDIGNEEKPALVLPQGWHSNSAKPDLYEMGMDPERKDNAALIRHRAEGVIPQTDEFATLMQSISAEAFVGQRVRMCAELKTEAVTGAGTIWMRVDGRAKHRLRFDNMEERSKDGVLFGNHDWATRQIVLDVPEDAKSVHYGFILRGAGQVWCRKIALEAVDQSVPETGGPVPNLKKPTNLDFLDIA